MKIRSLKYVEAMALIGKASFKLFNSSKKLYFAKSELCLRTIIRNEQLFGTNLSVNIKMVNQQIINNAIAFVLR